MSPKSHRTRENGTRRWGSRSEHSSVSAPNQGSLGLWEAGVPSVGGDDNEAGWWQWPDSQTVYLRSERKT